MKDGQGRSLLRSAAGAVRRRVRPQKLSMRRRVSIVVGAVMALSFGVFGYVAQTSRLGAQQGLQTIVPRGSSSVVLHDGTVLMSGGETSAGPVAAAWIVRSDGNFMFMASMNSARSNHASVVLADGRVLVAGGNGPAGALDSAEIYNPATNSWTSVASMSEARADLTATLLADGRVLVAGGGSLDVFDPESGSFSYAGALNPPRNGHAAALLQDGRVLLSGGMSSGSAIMFADIFDPASQVLHVASPLGTARSGHTATSLADGRVLIAGGSTNGVDLASVELFDPLTQRFSPSSVYLQIPRSDHMARLLPDGRVMISGGYSRSVPVTSIELLTPDDNAPATTQSSATKSVSAGAAVFGASAKPSADLDQCRNGTIASPVACAGGAWVNGNAGASNSHWLEGESIAYRMKFGGLSTGANIHSITFEWDTTQNGKHAIDYITSWDRSVPPNSDACTDVLGAGACLTPSMYPIPPDTNVTSLGVTPLPGQNLTLYGGSITGVSTNPAYTLSGSYAGSSSTRITVNFTAAVANPVLVWGGHIATRLDWGASSSAIAISGSPYHTRLVDIDGSTGSQDRSLSNDAVIFPASITIIKDVANGTSTQAFSFTTTSLDPTTFQLDDDGDNSNALSNTKVFSVTTFDTKTVTESTGTDFELTSITCTPVTSQQSTPGTRTISLVDRKVTFNLKEGESVSCTFLNTAKATVQLVKSITGPAEAGATFNLFIKQGTTTVASKSGVGNNGSTDVTTVSTGSYDFSETGGTASLSDYTSSIACTNKGAAIGSATSGISRTVTVGTGDAVVCTITNDRDTGKLEVKKSIASNPTNGKFTLQIDGSAPNQGSVDVGDGGTTGEKILPTGTHTVKEIAGTSTSLSDYTSSIQCKDNNGAGSTVASSTDAGPLNVNVTKGSDIVCTITNVRNTGKLEVTKSIASNPANGLFTLQIDAGTQNQIQASNVGNGGTTNEQTVPTGNHTVKEIAGTNTSLSDYTSSIQCKDNNGTGSVVASSTDAGPLTVNVTKDSDIVCVITNTFVKASPAGTTVLQFVFSDTVTITSIRTGGTPAATVDFRIYSSNACDQATEIASLAQTGKPINMNGTTGTASTGEVSIDNSILGASKTFWIQAHYTGDSLNNGFTTACTAETFQIKVTDNLRNGLP